MDSREYQFYFVGTPIGNFDEMTFRAVDILNSVDEIWCEDTIHSKPLLNHFKINKPLQSFHKYSDEKKVNECIEKLMNGKKIAYISDAGMPCISDPGLRLSRAMIENDIEFTVVSGACACINSLILSGFNTENFYFVGFLKEKAKEKQQQIEKVKNLECPLIFYSSVHNIEKDVKYLVDNLGDRDCVVVRELTKLYESVLRGKLSKINLDNVKGEFAIVVDGVKIEQTKMPMIDYLKIKLDELDYKDAIKETAKKYGVVKNQVYQLYLDNFKE